MANNSLIYSLSAARGPISLQQNAEQYPQLVDQLLHSVAESYPALYGKITAPIRQDSVSAARGTISLHSVAEQYPQLADPALYGKITAPIRMIVSILFFLYFLADYRKYM